MARAKKGRLETDLYRPLRGYLIGQGYTVRSEVMGCDIVATKGDALIVVEMKRRFGTPLLVQATRRQRIADSVYVALPSPACRPAGGDAARRGWEDAKHLLRRLELGLLLVSSHTKPPTVEVVFHPLPFQRQRRKKARRAVLQEAVARSGDYNVGGSTRRKLVTVYRENAVHIACCLAELGPLTPAQLRALGTGPKTLSILSNDVYGWFERITRGLYALRAQGREELKLYPRVVRRYRAAIPKQARLE